MCGHQVHRDQVHQVHQEHPDEDGQGQGGHQGVAAVEGILDRVVDELDDHLHEIVDAAGRTALGMHRYPRNSQQKIMTQADGPGHGVDMNCGETHGRGLGAAVGHGPDAALGHH